MSYTECIRALREGRDKTQAEIAQLIKLGNELIVIMDSKRQESLWIA